VSRLLRKNTVLFQQLPSLGYSARHEVRHDPESDYAHYMDWRVVSENWPAFATGACFGAGVTWLLVQLFYGTQVSHLKNTIEILRAVHEGKLPADVLRQSQRNG
jgi:hypothetical protein